MRSHLFTAWLLLRDPNTVVMVLSATGNKATEFISMTRNCIALMPAMKHLIWSLDQGLGFQLQRGGAPKVSQDLSIFARGISGQITGSHSDWVVLDDVEIEGNANTAEAREKLLHKVWKSSRSVTWVAASVSWVRPRFESIYEDARSLPLSPVPRRDARPGHRRPDAGL